MLGNARLMKRLFACLAIVWVLLLAGSTAYRVWPVFSGASALAWLSLLLALMVYDKFGDRVAMLESMETVPNQAREAMATAGMSAAGQPPRQP